MITCVEVCDHLAVALLFSLCPLFLFFFFSIGFCSLNCGYFYINFGYHAYNFIYLFIIPCMQLVVHVCITLSNIILFNNLLFDVNYKKSIFRMHYIYIFSILAKFQDNQRSIDMLSINYLNSSFSNLK